MNGPELERELFFHCRPLLFASIPDIMAVATCGIAGRFLYELSESEAGFCIFLEDEVLRDNQARIRDAIAMLPTSFKGRPVTLVDTPDMGPMGITAFYSALTGLDHVPESWQEWLAIPEEKLACATNGEIFEDGINGFSAWRKGLLDFYPRDVWLVKMASRLLAMSSSAQQLLPAAMKRPDPVGAMLCAAEFSKNALGLIYLFNKRYMPPYAWASMLARDLPILGRRLSELLEVIAAHSFKIRPDQTLLDAIEDFCAACSAHLMALALSGDKSSWLWAQGLEVASRIENEEMRKLDLLHLPEWR